MLPNEYNSRPFCLPKWTLRGSSSLSKDPQITSEKGWVMGGFCWDGGGEQGRGGRRVTGKWLGRSTAPGEMCTLSLWTASNAISHCLATSGFGWTEWKTPKKGKRKKKKNIQIPAERGLDLLTTEGMRTASEPRLAAVKNKSGSWQVKEKKNGALQAHAFRDNKNSALHSAKLYKQYKANTCVNHHSQHSADIMSQYVTG